MIHKRKNDELDFIRTKNFWSLKVSVKRKKGQATDWDKIFTNCDSDKECVYRLHEEL